jgi:nucleotide-binding universal stress UspA family protein
MIADLLVCLEGSPATDEATRVAIETARDLAATLVGLAIVDEPDIRAGAAVGIGGASFKHDRDEALMSDARVQAHRWLARFSARCAEEGVTARTLERVGRPSAEILDQMQHHDVTVLGRGANFRFETEASDAATRDAVLHHAVRPVLLVPDQPAAAGADVLIAFDGGGAAARAAASFVQSGLAARGAIHIATVGVDGAHAWDVANRAAETLRALGVSPALHNVVSTQPTADALLELREKLGARVIVMGAYTRLRISELLTGSVTRELIEKTPVPLYLAH